MFALKSLDAYTHGRAVKSPAKVTICTVLLGAFTFAGALVTAQEAPAENWLPQALERELELLEATNLASADGAFKASIPGTASEPQLIEDQVYYFTVDFGPEVPAECYAYKDEKDLASFLRLVSENLFSVLEGQEIFDSLENTEIEDIAGGAIGNSPYLGVDWLYTAKRQDELLAGQASHRASSKEGRTIYCSYNELGYVKTFESLFKEIVSSIEWSTAEEEELLLYSEVWLGRVQGLPGMVASIEIRRDGEDYKIYEVSSSLLPADSDELAAQDEFEVSFSAPDGSLINALSVHVENGELVTNLSLDPAADGTWEVSGTFLGKDFSTTIPAEEIPSTIGASALTQNFLETAEAGASLEVSSWATSIDPSTFDSTVVTFNEAIEGGYATSMSMAGAELEAEFDSCGMMRKAAVDLGHVGLKLERLRVFGEVPEIR